MNRQRQERRTQPRTALAGPVRLSWETEDRGYRYALGKLEDISTSGLRVKVVEPIPVRAFVKVHVPDQKLFTMAVARYCDREKMRYQVGVEFTSGTRWKPADSVRE